MRNLIGKIVTFACEILPLIAILIEIIVGLMMLLHIDNIETRIITCYVLISIYLIVVLAILFKTWYIDPKKKR